MENFLKVEQNFMSKFQAALETIEILFDGGAGGGGGWTAALFSTPQRMKD